jgi:molybdate transport system substrate-binding protein
MKVAAFFAVLMAGVQCAAANAAEVRVIASATLPFAFKDLGPRFKQATGNTLTVQYGLDALQAELIAGGDFDVAIGPAKLVDDGIKSQKIVAGTRTTIARIDLAVGVRAGAPKPDVSTHEAFKKALVAADSIAYAVYAPTAPMLVMDFEKLGVGNIVSAKTKPSKAIPIVREVVAGGDAELGIAYTCDLLALPGVDVAGPLPADMRNSIVMAAGVGSSARDRDAAEALVKFLRTPEAVSILKSRGFEPVTPAPHPASKP